MSASLKEQILNGVWQVAERHDYIVSATVTGSFIDKPSLDGISDIDCVVIVDHLNESRYQTLQQEFARTLRPILQQHGYALRINPTLGPLKFNEPKLAVLHLMLYSEPAHVEHVLKSPFTCLDWQRSPTYRKRSLGEVFPVFGLQPRHFLNSRRGMMDYLTDFNAGSISYRELVCTAEDYAERATQLPMNERDRHEFAYHVIRFLMSNLLKLLTRSNTVYSAEKLLAQYFAICPERRVEFESPYLRLKSMKDQHDFTQPIEHLGELLRTFIESFERQFRQLFVETATRHVVIRHAPTQLNDGQGEEVRFVGRVDPDVCASAFSCDEITGVLANCNLKRVYASPARRTRQTVERLMALRELPSVQQDERLHEQSYGELEGRTVRAAREGFPHLFAAWNRGEDPRLPGGESMSDVHDRVYEFVSERWTNADGDSLTCTHNVVMRCLIGATLGVPKSAWHRLRVPHLTPFTFIQTRSHGLFLDVAPECERRLFSSFHRCLAG